MEIKELLESIQIEGAGNGDVVFIGTPAGMSGTEFIKFSEALKSHVDQIRATDTYFPRCIVMPPGVTVDVARFDSKDRIEITSDLKMDGEIKSTSPDDGFPYG